MNRFIPLLEQRHPSQCEESQCPHVDHKKYDMCLQFGNNGISTKHYFNIRQAFGVRDLVKKSKILYNKSLMLSGSLSNTVKYLFCLKRIRLCANLNSETNEQHVSREKEMFSCDDFSGIKFSLAPCF